MEQLKELKKGKTLFGFVCTLILKTFQNIMDIICVSTCFWTVFGLIYLTFLKDTVEIFAYTTVKYTNRLKWLYQILRIKKLFELSEISAPDVTSGTSSKLSSVLSSQSTHHSKTSVKSVVEGENQPSPYFQSSPNYNEVAERFFGNPAIPSVSAVSDNHITTLPGNVTIDDCNIIDETNFEDVPLTSDRQEEVVLDTENSSSETSNLKLNTSNRKFNKTTLLDSFRRSKLLSLGEVKAKCENVAEKVSKAFAPEAEDKEKLVSKNDSPEKLGCLAAFSHTFKAKFQMSPSTSTPVPYKKF